MRILKRNLIRVCTCVTAVMLCTLSLGCEAKEVLPEDPGLLQSSFGTGVKLMMAYSEAIDVAEKLDRKSRLKIKILTREKLQATNPYTDRSSEKDLVIALYDDPAAATPDTPFESLGIIREIRCYLADPSKSGLTYENKNISSMGPSDMISLLGKPYSTNVYNGIETHLVYRFSAVTQEAEKQARIIKFITSHMTNDTCYAFSLALESEW